MEIGFPDVAIDGATSAEDTISELAACYSCTRCLEAFSHWSSFVAHTGTDCSPHIEDTSQSTGLKAWSCPKCQIKFSRLSSFRSHLRIHEEDEVDDEGHVQPVPDPPALSGDVSSLKLFCAKCNIAFESKSDFVSHRATHGMLNNLLKTRYRRRKETREANFRHRCEHCDKTFKKPSQFRRHERIHTGEKPFECELCGKTFNQKNSLEIHGRKHTGEKPFTCLLCNMTFSQKGNLRTHIQRVHRIASSSEANFVCNDCPCSFKNIGSLNSHLAKVHMKSKKMLRGVAKDNSKKAAAPPSVNSANVEQSNSCAFPESTDGVLALARTGPVELLLAPTLQLQMFPSLTECAFTEMDDVHNNAADASQSRQILDPIIASVGDEGSLVFNPCDLGLDLSSLPLAPATSSAVLQLINNDGTATTVHMPFEKAQNHPTLRVDDVATILGSTPIGNASGPSTATYFQKDKKVKGTSKKISQAEVETSVSEEVFKQSLAEKEMLFEDVSPPVAASTRGSSNSRLFPCTFCAKCFRKPSDLSRHERTHTGERPFSCDLCPKKFSLASTLEYHRQHLHLGKTSSVQCHVCSLLFASKACLKTHMRLHTGARPYKCPQCHQCFRTTGQRAHHVGRAHQHGAKNKRGARSDNAKGDEDIGAVFHVDPDAALAHDDGDEAGVAVEVTLIDPEGMAESLAIFGQDGSLRIAGVNVKLEAALPTSAPSSAPTSAPSSASASAKQPRSSRSCSFCGKSFSKPSQLTRHQRVHTGERPFPCTQCPKTFNQKNSLRAHMDKHNGVRPFVCPFCSYAFTQKCNLKTHVGRAHAAQAQRLLEEKALADKVNGGQSPTR